MKNPARKLIASTVLAGLALFGAFTQSASAYDLDSLSGAVRTCQNGVHSSAVAMRLDGWADGKGHIIISGDLQDPCTDGQNAIIYYRQVGYQSASAWGSIQTGQPTVHFTRTMNLLNPSVLDVQIQVCRTGGDQACSPLRYLHTL